MTKYHRIKVFQPAERSSSKLWQRLTKALIGTAKQQGRIEQYHTYEWVKVRSLALERDHYECQVCADLGGHRPAEVVHHIHPAEDFPEKFTDQDNLVSLCRECHETLHGRIGFKDKFPEFT